MVTEIILFFILLLLIYFYGQRKGFDNMLNIWIIIMYVFLICIYNKILSFYVFIALFILFKYVRIPIILTLAVLITVIKGKYETMRVFSYYIFTCELDTQINIINIPNKPTIFLSNYPRNYIEYFIPMLLGNKICILTNNHSTKISSYFYGYEHIIKVEKGKFYDLQGKIRSKMNSGYHIFAYIEKDHSKKKKNDLTKVRSGMFSIAKNLNVTITPITCDHIEHILGILNTAFKINIGKTRYVKDVKKEMEKTSIFFTKNLRRMRIK